MTRLSGGTGLPRAGRRRPGTHAPELVYRNMRPLVQPTIQPPAPRIIQNTVHQTVVHLHQTTHQHILNRLSAAGGGREHTTLLVQQTAMQPAPESAMDGSRPALAARRMLRILSAESARQTLRPFYRGMLQGLLEQEREAYRGKPAQALLLMQRMLGRHQMLTTLHRLYRRTTEQLEGSILHRIVYRRYVRCIQQGENGLLFRYTSRERPVPEELRSLPVAKRYVLPSPPGQESEQEPRAEPQKPAPAPAGGLSLSGGDFQLLVRGVAEALGRQSRLDSLRRGGM